MDLSVFEKALDIIAANNLVCPLAAVHKDFPWKHGNTKKEVVLIQFGNDIFHVMLVIPVECNVPPRTLAQVFYQSFCTWFVRFADSKVKPFSDLGSILELMTMKAGLSRWVEEVKLLTEKNDYSGIVDFHFCVSFAEGVKPIAGAGVTAIASTEEEYNKLKSTAEALKQQREEVYHEHEQLH